MKVILNRDLYDGIWKKIYNDFKFKPTTDISVVPFKFSINYKRYKLNGGWEEGEEKIVNNIFKEMSDNDIYALDWQHDCFEFNPKEDIPLYYHYHDYERDVEVYFPRYYPDGDYYFFISKDFSYGLLGHLWRRELYVFGDDLINKFDNCKKKLNIHELKKTNFFDNLLSYIKGRG